MPKIQRSLQQALAAAGFAEAGPEGEAKAQELLLQAQQKPEAVVAEMCTLRGRLAKTIEQRNAAAEAARKLQEMIEGLLEGSARLYFLVCVREAERSVVAQIRGETEEFPVHPDVDLEELRNLEPWEMLRVREGVVIGTWRGDLELLEAAQGEVAEFRDYHSREHHLVRAVRRGGEEEVVRLARNLRDRELTTGQKLVLHRSVPGWAIDVLPTESTRSRFELPIERIETGLEDLAGLEGVAAEILEEILLRMVRSDVCEPFDVQPLRGALLVSRRPGMGKTALIRALARFLHELGQRQGFDVALYVVKPGALKNMYWGEDARIVREDLFVPIRARQAEPRSRPLIQIVVLDEVDSIGRRAGADHARTSAAQDDVLHALLAEMDGMEQECRTNGTAARLLTIGMTNREDRLDAALKRPGRLGDLIVHMPAIDLEGGVGILSVYSRASSIPWYLDGQVKQGVDLEEVRARILRPAVARIFDAVVLRYTTDAQKSFDVTAGEIFAGVHYMNAMRLSKQRAARRAALGRGAPAIGFSDVLESLVDTALTQAGQLEADRSMLVRELDLKVPVARVDAVPRAELSRHRFVRAESA